MVNSLTVPLTESELEQLRGTDRFGKKISRSGRPVRGNPKLNLQPIPDEDVRHMVLNNGLRVAYAVLMNRVRKQKLDAYKGTVVSSEWSTFVGFRAQNEDRCGVGLALVLINGHTLWSKTTTMWVCSDIAEQLGFVASASVASVIHQEGTV